ncbi:MAG TPA: diguanylate cyclase [Vicinamibacteria bacterium]|nr:diguanylate cyclase [Vicinamibacteria bacterium]
MHSPTRAAKIAAMASPPAIDRPTILVADDSTVALHMLEALFRGAGYGVVTVTDGLLAVEAAFTRPVDLIVLDVTMPHLNGYQACRLLKSDEQTRSIPVVILTSRDQAGDRFWGLRTGADAYLTKDTAPQQLLELVARTLAARGPVSPPPFSARTETTIDVLARVNDLLDRQLYEATILSEIGRVARSPVRLDETVTSVLGLIGRVVDFALGVVAFVDGDEMETVFVLRHPDTEAAVQAIRGHVMETVLRHRPGAGLREVRTRVLTPADGGEGAPGPEGLDVCRTFPVVTGQQLVAVFALAGRALARIPPETEALLAQVTNQAHIVIENGRLIERLRDLSIRDGLTELYNHRFAMELLANELPRADRYASALSVLLMDIDRFKRVNDQYGHQTGDLILRAVARSVATSLRTVDTAGRYGGEEFLVILPQTGHGPARGTAERLRRAVEEARFAPAGGDIRVTVSIGIATYPAEGVHTVSDLVLAADKALYRAKEAGRNCVVGDRDPAPEPSSGSPEGR